MKSMKSRNTESEKRKNTSMRHQVMRRRGISTFLRNIFFRKSSLEKSHLEYRNAIMELQGQKPMSEREWTLATTTTSTSSTDVIELRNVANALFEGSGGINADQERAVKLWAKAAEKGDVRSMYSLAIQYMSNPKTIDRVKARDLLESALAKLEPDDKETERLVTFALGTLEEAEKGDDNEIAMNLYLRSAKRGHPGACFKIGQNYQKNEEFENARQWFVNGAALGHADCYHSLSTMYVNGVGGAQDFEKVMCFFSRSHRYSTHTPHASAGF